MDDKLKWVGKMSTRRNFIKGTSALLVASTFAMSAASYCRIRGANERTNVALMGARNRGKALLDGFINVPNCVVTHICDIDRNVLAQSKQWLLTRNQPPPFLEQDVRNVLEDSNLDALAIATPEHCHASTSIWAMQADKHVYVENPCAPTPAEGEQLVAAQNKYNKVVQMGNRQRSSNETAILINAVHKGKLGDIYKVYVWSDDSSSNAIHELDIARWLVHGEYPDKVSVSATGDSLGKNDWQVSGDMHVEFTFDGYKEVVWEVQSNKHGQKWGRKRGVFVYGSKGYAILDPIGYEIYDLHNKLTCEKKADHGNKSNDSTNTNVLTRKHVNNFVSAIHDNSTLQTSPIDEGYKSTLMYQLANIAYRCQHTLTCNPMNGIPNSSRAKHYWQQQNKPGWALKI